MQFNDLKTRICIKAYTWRTRAEAGTLTAELINTKNEVLAIIYACPETYGLGKFRVIVEDRNSIEAIPLEKAVLVAETLAGVKYVNLINTQES